MTADVTPNWERRVRWFLRELERRPVEAIPRPWHWGEPTRPRCAVCTEAKPGIGVLEHIPACADHAHLVVEALDLATDPFVAFHDHPIPPASVVEVTFRSTR